MKKITAKAPSNIAFIKYWGKANPKLRLPLSDSISMNLSNIYTITTVEFSKDLKKDQVEMDGEVMKEEEIARVTKHLDRVRNLADIKLKAKVKTKNNFPKGTGVASSASGFAALSLAASEAAGLKLSKRKLSILARLGSGSACRSIPDGFVEWRKGKDSNSSYSYSLYSPKYWSLVDIVAMVDVKEKKVSSTKGHGLAKKSPFLATRVNGLGQKLKIIKKTIKDKNFEKFGEILEEDTLNMHAVMMTSTPAILYWQGKTIEIMQAIRSWREEGTKSYFTIDAGPTVHIKKKKKDVLSVKRKLSQISGIKMLVVNETAKGAHFLNKHLF